MNKKELLDLLVEIDKTRDLFMDYEKVTKAVEYLRNELTLESFSNGGDKKRYQAAIKFLKKMEKTGRPILSTIDYQFINGKECQVFTDSFSAFCFAPNDYILNLPTKDDKDGMKGAKYPQLKALLEPMFNYSSIKINVKTTDFYNDFNLNYRQVEKIKLYELKINEDITVQMDQSFLKAAFSIMNFKNEIEIIYIGDKRPLIFKNSDSDSFCIILPIRRFY